MKSTNLFTLTATILLQQILPTLLLLTSSSLLYTQTEVNDNADETVSDPAVSINAANQLVRDGKFSEAIDAYSEIDTDYRQPQLNYNLAIAKYRSGDFDAAATLFANVAGGADAALADDSQYNLGNCHYSKALKQVEPTQKNVPRQLKPQDKAAAIADLRTAISFYRGSLRGNQDNADARANIELAVELIKKLQEETPPEDEKKEDQQNQDLRDEQEKKDEQEKRDEQEKKETPKDSPSNDDDQGGDKKENESQDESQKDEQGNESKEDKQQNGDKKQGDPKDGDQEQGEQENPSDPKNESEQKQDSKNESPTQQQPRQQAEDQKTGDPPSGEEESDKPDGKKAEQPAAGELTSENQEKQKGAVAQASGKEEMRLMTNEEALKMLQSVRDRDMLRRLQIQQRERSRRIPVDKDW